jgi:hypothetical protein
LNPVYGSVALVDCVVAALEPLLDELDAAVAVGALNDNVELDGAGGEALGVAGVVAVAAGADVCEDVVVLDPASGSTYC